MQPRWAILAPIIVFVFHSLLLAGCTAMVLRSPDNSLAMVYLMPIMVVDMPATIVAMIAAPALDGLAENLAPALGGGRAAAAVYTGWFAVVGPLHWLAGAWLLGRWIDRKPSAPHRTNQPAIPPLRPRLGDKPGDPQTQP